MVRSQISYASEWRPFGPAELQKLLETKPGSRKFRDATARILILTGRPGDRNGLHNVQRRANCSLKVVV